MNDTTQPSKEVNEYEQQALDFLRGTATLIEIVFDDTVESGIDGMGERHRNRYNVTLWNDKGSHEFEYTGSINDFEKGVEPTTYDILACIDAYTPVLFKDFCSDFDYQINGGDLEEAEQQIKEIRGIHAACLSMSAALNKMFTDEELETLGEIS